MLIEPNYFLEISQHIGCKQGQIQTVWELHLEGATVPFIARYRQERTGGLDEVQIREILSLHTKIESLYKAKQTAINGITEQGKMTPELLENIIKAQTLKEVEEIYKPYKSKKKTLAMLAIEKGFQVIADAIKKNISREALVGNAGMHSEKNVGYADLRTLQESYPLEEILEGAGYIIAAEIVAQSDLRATLKESLENIGILSSKMRGEKALSKLNEKDTAQIEKFRLYENFSGNIKHLKSYQILALNRGEKLGILSIKIENNEKAYSVTEQKYATLLRISEDFSDLLQNAFTQGYNTLFDSVENEIRSDKDEAAQDDAIETFQKNLGQLLRTKPEYGKRVFAIDPGFKAGCKIVILDAGGNPLLFEKIFLFAKEESQKKIASLLEKYPIDVIVLGNGTGSNETLELLQQVFEYLISKKSPLQSLQENIYIVNESGASVYSASEVAAEEFPELESLERGTISLGRRYLDPLSELVKIPVGSIGVGMYQHDITEKKLEEKLGYVVEDVVNDVGININTASTYVLQYISGINKTTAKKLFKNRPYSSRADLKKHVSQKIFEQAAGFLRVSESSEILDTTDIHPEQYALARYLSQQKITLSQSDSFYQSEKQKLQELYQDTTVQTLEFIINSLEKAGIEKRINSSHQKAIFRGNIEHKVGDIVDGIVRNVVAFGAFVDIGMKQDGLVHVSQIANRYISDPKEEVEVGQSVRVKITALDSSTGKIQLSMKEALSV